MPSQEEVPDLSIAVPVPVSAEKAARFQELLNKAFMEKREQVFNTHILKFFVQLQKYCTEAG